jgi:hypothetical protein
MFLDSRNDKTTERTKGSGREGHKILLSRSPKYWYVSGICSAIRACIAGSDHCRHKAPVPLEKDPAGTF